MTSKKLFDIVPEFLVRNWQKKADLPISDLVFDSRDVTKGSLFFAISGAKADGHDYVRKALESGASAVVVERESKDLNESQNVILVEDSRKMMGHIASLFFDEPSERLELVGITGTNGKTTIATLLFQLLSEMGVKCGLISTVFYSDGENQEDATHTTPDPIRLNKYLSRMVKNECTHAFMEVSSHAIDQKRIEGVQFAGGVFTNLSHDHLDYHKTFLAYRDIKKSFFDQLDTSAFALYNLDDKNGSVMVQNCKSRKLGYSLKQLTDIKGKVLSNTIEGLHMSINDRQLYARLVGMYNAYNLLAAYGVAEQLGFEQEEILLGLSRLQGAVGRFELVRGERKKIFAVVDYAHTPDALENILSTLVELKKANTKIICIVGCGGDRDAKKRPLMARIAADLSDTVILTSDNPRSEEPETILDDMEKGLGSDQENVLRIVDRRQAIKTGVMMSKEGDIILVAGKGHEKYQDINGIKHPFDDKEEVEQLVLNKA